ncbi:hypothetical protein B0H13DRAFT_2359836 [Mycena leptocephala]|nr:hypothetical protein B0H13DRAFT_2359836 [Mycena leptocephala]
METYLRRFTQISGYLRELGFLTRLEVQVYFVAGLPFETRKAVEARLPDANRGTDSPPTKCQVMHILHDLLRRDSFETFVASRLFPHNQSSLLPSSSDLSPPSDSQSQVESKPKRQSHRCFVCGGTGTHRLGPKFCPRTWELVEHRLARFQPDGRLVSRDGSPLPMTRNSGGVAAHLFASSLRHRLRTPFPSAVHLVDISARDVLSNSNPPQSPIAVRRPPSPSLPPIPFASIPFDDSPSPSRSNLNPPHRSCSPRVRTAPVVPSARIHLSSLDKIPEPHSPLPSHSEPSSTGLHPPPYPKFNPPQPSLPSHSPDSIYSLPPEFAPTSSGVDDGDPKRLSQAITMPIGDILAISPLMRAKFAEYICHLDSISASKPIRDPPLSLFRRPLSPRWRASSENYSPIPFHHLLSSSFSYGLFPFTSHPHPSI